MSTTATAAVEAVMIVVAMEEEMSFSQIVRTWHCYCIPTPLSASHPHRLLNPKRLAHHFARLQLYAAYSLLT